MFPPENLVERKQSPIHRGRPEPSSRVGKNSVRLGNGRKTGHILSRENDGAHAVEADQTILRRQPHIAVAGLRNGPDGRGQQAVGGLPHAQEKILFRSLEGALIDSGVLTSQRHNSEGAPQSEVRDDAGGTFFHSGDGLRGNPNTKTVAAHVHKRTK